MRGDGDDDDAMLAGDKRKSTQRRATEEKKVQIELIRHFNPPRRPSTT